MPDDELANGKPNDLRPIGDVQEMRLRRTAATPTADQVLWMVIRNSTNQLSFGNYMRFMDRLMCPPQGTDVKIEANEQREKGKRFFTGALPFPGVEPYRLLKAATEVFLTLNAGVLLRFDSKILDLEAEGNRVERTLNAADLDTTWKKYLQQINGAADQKTVPYLQLIARKLHATPVVPPYRFAKDEEGAATPEGWFERCEGVLQEKLLRPLFIELIWSYWHEEGMLVQTLNAISQRFQNVRGAAANPLATLEIDPLRPLSNLLWGYIQDEQHRLTVLRRAYEYDHHYGLTLVGKAVPPLQAADSRSRFLEAFHTLLYECAVFYRSDDDTTVIADGFRVLNALKEVHLLLSEGAHNQYGDLPSTARIEMLMQQWLLARDEFREFLPTRTMVAYPEPWMDRVEAMKRLQGWTDASVVHFHNLGVFGEQILLSIRFGAWSTVNDPAQGANWARYWRPEIQGYMHGYRVVTGVALADDAVDTRRQDSDRYLPPAVHLQRRLGDQRTRVGIAGADAAALPSPARATVAPAAPARLSAAPTAATTPAPAALPASTTGNGKSGRR